MLGITGSGRATIQNGTVQIDFTSTFLGHVTCALTLSENFMNGQLAVFGVPAPIYLQRI